MGAPHQQRRLADPDCRGKEIFEVKPVILGGSPTDPANKVLLSRDEHIQAVRYWNEVIAELRAKSDRARNGRALQ